MFPVPLNSGMALKFVIPLAVIVVATTSEALLSSVGVTTTVATPMPSTLHITSPFTSISNDTTADIISITSANSHTRTTSSTPSMCSIIDIKSLIKFVLTLIDISKPEELLGKPVCFPEHCVCSIINFQYRHVEQ